MTKKHRQRFFLAIGAVGLLLACPILVIATLFSNYPAYLPVKERALRSAQEALANIEDVAPAGIAYGIATYHPDCYDFLREHLEANDQYTLVVTAAIDPGSWDATVAVRFVDKSEVELYFYQGTWESCYNLRQTEKGGEGESES